MFLLRALKSPIDDNVNQKIQEIVKKQMRQGVSSRDLALTFAVVVVLGTFPILGATTFLCFITAWFLGLNQPIIQALNYSLTPLHLLMIPLFLKAGQVLFDAPGFIWNPIELQKLFLDDWILFLQRFGWAGVHAIVVWILTMPFIGVVVFFIARPVLEKVKRNRPTSIE